MQPNGMIFWDWNGTLMDDVDFTHGCLNWMLESHGYPQRYDLAQYREMEVFTQFSSDLDETTKRQLIYGQGLMRLLRQPQNHPYQQHQQVILLVAALDHVMQTVPLARMDDFRTGLLTYIETQDQALCRRIDESGQLSDEDRETILKLSREFLTRFQTEAVEKSGE